MNEIGRPYKQFTDALQPGEVLRYRSVCQRGHVGPTGENIALIKNGNNRGCLACLRHMPLGPFTETFEGVEARPERRNEHLIKYHTDEEKRLARSRASARWNAKNPELAKSYRDKYQARKALERRLGLQDE